MAGGGIIWRGGSWHMRMTVPRRYRHLDGVPGEIHRTLKTDSEAEALRRRPSVATTEIARLDALLAGEEAPRSRSHFETLARLAVEHGRAFRTAEELAAGPIEELVSRLFEHRTADPRVKDPAIAGALLGGAARPRYRVSDLPEMYKAEQTTKLDGRDGRALAKWINPYSEAAGELSQAAGDKFVDDLTREDFVEKLARHLRNLVTKGRMDRHGRLVRISTGTAQKKLSRLGTLLSCYRRKTGTDLTGYVNDIYLAGAPGTAKEKRRELPEQWISDTIMTHGILDGMNQGARDMLLVMVETGAIGSELCRAPAEAFCLDDPFPHIDLHKVRLLKSDARPRKLVLVGRALEAAQRWPEGFPYSQGESLSACIRKYFSENKLWPDEETRWVPYCLRHSFEGRMRRARVDNFFAARMMGHAAKSAIGREVYGDDLEPWQSAAVMDCIRLDFTLERRQAARKRLDEILPPPDAVSRP